MTPDQIKKNNEYKHSIEYICTIQKGNKYESLHSLDIIYCIYIKKNQIKQHIFTIPVKYNFFFFFFSAKNRWLFIYVLTSHILSQHIKKKQKRERKKKKRKRKRKKKKKKKGWFGLYVPYNKNNK